MMPNLPIYSVPDNIQSVEEIVGMNVRRARTAYMQSQKSLGDMLSITFQQVQKNERGTNRISAGRIYALSRIYGVPIQSFFDGLECVDPPEAMLDSRVIRLASLITHMRTRNIETPKLAEAIEQTLELIATTIAVKEESSI